MSFETIIGYTGMYILCSLILRIGFMRLYHWLNINPFLRWPSKSFAPKYELCRESDGYYVMKWKHVWTDDVFVSWLFAMVIPFADLYGKRWETDNITFRYANSDADLLTKTECISKFYEREFQNALDAQSEENEHYKKIQDKIKSLTC